MKVFIDSIYHDFFSVCALVPCVFMATMGMILLAIPRRSRATTHLALSYLLIAFFLSGYVIAAMLYHPVAAYHRWITVGTISFCAVHFIVFLILFPDNRHPVLATRLGILLHAVSIILTASFIFATRHAESFYNFEAHHFDLKTGVFNAPIAIYVLILLGIMLFTGLIRTLFLKEPGRWPLLAIILITFITIIPPAVANLLSRYGMMDRGAYLINQDIFIIAGFFAVFVIYLNSTNERTSLMAKVMGISLATFLIILQGLSYISLSEIDYYYDQICHRDLMLAIAAGRRPPGLSYLARYSSRDRALNILVHSGERIEKDGLLEYENELFNTAIREEIAGLAGLRAVDFTLGLKRLLKSDNAYFSGYAASIQSIARRIPVSDPNRAAALLREFEGLEGRVHTASAGIARLPEENFKQRLIHFLHGFDREMEPFRSAMIDCCMNRGLEGPALRREALRYLSPMPPAGVRHYRALGRPPEHVTAYSYFDPGRHILYEAGFDYRLYRARHHPIAMKYVLMTGVLLLTVVGGFQLFFLGAFIRPLRHLLRAIHRVREGNYEVVIPVPVRDELGYISHNFNEMVSNLNLSKEVLSDYAENLAKMVAERTEELSRARDELWGEMMIARKMQSIMIPREPRMNGYEITGYMLPAERMGGDYYDVINMEGTDWVIIGDVSGHGVPSGIIMMMVQTSIKAVLSDGSGLPPAELLRRVNGVITDNIKMIGDDRYMTITIMAFRENGECAFAGLHQDILIYRARSNDIETVKSDGIWLGIMEYTVDMIVEKTLRMEQGDIMLLYTDGITEAWRKGSKRDRRNPLTDMYGIERLKGVFYENRARSPGETRDKVVESLDGYSCVDDVTMVILRKT